MPPHLHIHRVSCLRPQIELDCTDKTPESITYFNRIPSPRRTLLMNEFSSLAGGDHDLLHQQADELITPTCFPLSMEYTCVFTRLATFTQSFVSKASPRHLANAGFYWVGFALENEKIIRDKVACFWCGYSASSWKSTPSPQKIHSRVRPDCPFVRNVLKPKVTDEIVQTVISLWSNTPLVKFLKDTYS